MMSAVLFAFLVQQVPAAVPAPPTREDFIVADAGQALREIQAVPDRGIPTSLLREAKGLILVPGLKKVGFFVGGQFGRGIAVVRQADGRWSNPVFIRMGGGGFGAQAGVEAQDLILVCRTERSMRWLFNGQEFTLDVNAGAAAGPVGRNLAAGTNLRLDAEILSYSRSRGLFAGVAITGGRVRVDHRANADFYRVPGIGVNEILRAANLPVPASAARFQQILAKASAAPAVEIGNPPPGSGQR